MTEVIKFKAAYSSGKGKVLDVRTSFRDGTTPQAIVDAVGDIVARLVHHAVGTHSDVDPEQLIAEIFGKANDIYPTLPAITDEMRKDAEQSNEESDPEPEYRSLPSGDDQQILSCGLSLRVNGFEVYQGGAGTEPVPFDDIPVAAAGIIGALTAYGLTGAVTPANVLSHEDEALEAFKAAWAMNMSLGKMQRQVKVAEVQQKQRTKFIFGELEEEN